MLIFVAHTGRSLEVSVQSSTRVAIIVDTLSEATGIPQSSQILMMVGGILLEPSKELSSYALPGFDGDARKHVYLYNKANLRLQGAMPPKEVVEPLETDAEQLEDDHKEVSKSNADAVPRSAWPPAQGLAEYDQKFKGHLREARRAWHLAERAHARCSALVSEMEVQSSAIEVARTNVETHYTYIHRLYDAFARKVAQQQKSHGEVLADFERDLQALAAVELHPTARSEQCSHLIHLIDADSLRQWSHECQKRKSSLAQKVGSLEELIAKLKADIEAMFMQAPTVQLEDLESRLLSLKPRVEELASIGQVMESSVGRLAKMTHEAGSLQRESPLDSILDNHENHLLPTVRQARASFKELYLECLQSKDQMTWDVIGQLQSISRQQAHIKSLRDKMAVFTEAALKQDDMFAQLLAVRRLPAAYRQCLLECMRRRAGADEAAGLAQQMAERMASLRQKELERREAFGKSVQAYIPASILAGLGLNQQPSHCQISLPPPPPGLASVSVADLQKAPMTSASAGSVEGMLPFAAGGDVGRSPPSATGVQGEAQEPRDALELENARLKAELASHLADQCGQVLGAPPGGTGQAALEKASEPREAQMRSLQAAVAAKQELVLCLERRLVQAQQLSSAQESRVCQLEARLAKLASRRPDVASVGAQTVESSSSTWPDSGLVASETGSVEAAGALALTPVITSPSRSNASLTLAQQDAVSESQVEPGEA